MKQALILYATREGQTAKVAATLNKHLATLGVQSTAHNLEETFDSTRLVSVDLLIFGGSMHAGGIESELVHFVNRNSAAISQRPRAFFLVLLSAATADAKLRETSLADARQKLTGQFEVDFKDIEFIAGALTYSKYTMPLRWLMQRIARQHGADTDTKRDYEYTDWQHVKTYAQRLYKQHLADT